MASDKLVDQSGAADDAPQEIANNDPSYYGGVLCDAIQEPIPKRINTTGEKCINRGNAWIVLGRDRPGSRASGFGGAGATQAAAIDLCVGMGASNPGPATGEYVDPNFKGDAARVYISQRCDIDDAFRLKRGGSAFGGMFQSDTSSKSDVGFPENQSAIGIKADSVRIIGVNGIKLITRPQNNDSRGGRAAFSGIELIAGNADDKLQYMVKGENLVESLEQLEERIKELSSIVLNFLSAQIKVNASIASHTHQGFAAIVPVTTFPAFGLAGTAINTMMDEFEGVIDNLTGRINLNILWHHKYLNPMSSKYILSKYNKVN